MAVTRTKRTSRNNSNISDFAKAAADRGRDAGNVIANQVVDRIVNNSTREFQDYLARTGSGNAVSNASALVPEQPSPVPFGQFDQVVDSPTPFGSFAAMLNGGMPDTTGMPLQPAPFVNPPALMPMPIEPASIAMPSVLPSPPPLTPSRPAPFNSGMESLLRSFGLI